MKKKTRKQGKRRRSARHQVSAVHARRRTNSKKQSPEPTSVPWLRIVPAGIEDELDAADFRESSTRRNGRHKFLDVDLYIPESKSRTR
jgi:hypothetical protein